VSLTTAIGAPNVIEILLLALLLLAAKDLACVWGLTNQMRGDGAIARRLESGDATQADFDDYVAESNPIDGTLYRMNDGSIKNVLTKVFRSWFTVSVGSATVFALAGATPSSLVLCLGIATGLNAVLHLVTAVVRRLILGHHDSRASDVQVATLTRNWAVARDPLGNLSLYFLLLVYLAIVGFAGLYRSIDAFDAHAFAYGHLALSAVTWIYLSITTIATVGFGDIHPLSVGAQIAVICQIATGPLLLSWLIAVFATQPRESRSDR
jgi:hypothetical protein